ncbi:MAG: HAMP domain-containing protein [Epsilonproteobacteria bacterium]|nr:HAMP domain-containing protein [Campylobacterota bacterium]
MSLLFLLGLSLMVGLGLYLEQLYQGKNRELIINRYLVTARELLPLLAMDRHNLLRERARELGFEMEEGREEGETILQRKILFGHISIIERRDHHLSLLLTYLGRTISLYDKSQGSFHREYLTINLLIILDALILILLYLSVVTLLHPLKELSRSIRQFARGEYTTRVEPRGGAELERVAESFNLMAEKIEESILEREHLLRFIGHELKTPLAKSRFALERRDLSSLKRAIDQIERLTKRVLDLHTITIAHLKEEEMESETLLLSALERCCIDDEEKIEIESEPFTIRGDRELLSIALKNLIDNGLRYSTAFPIKILSRGGVIEIVSYGEPLGKGGTRGSGLGLLIVEQILSKHRLELHYTHSHGVNIFRIPFTLPSHHSHRDRRESSRST